MTLLENLNIKEEKAIEKLEKRMKHHLTEGMRSDESLYYRFLKARDFDVNKAEKMMMKNITFRKVNQVDTVLEDFTPIEFFRKFPEPALLGYDKEGNQFGYVAAGKLDPHDIMRCMTMSSFMKHWVWFGEHRVAALEAENKRTGRKATRGTIIIDLEDLTFANTTAKASIDMLLRLLSFYQDNYPERMEAAFIINAPSYFVVIFAIIKKIMSTAMLNKIYIFGNSGWKEKLLEMIDAEELPAFLGGTRTDPDGNPLCKTFVRHGGKTPEYYFATPEERYFTDISQVKKLNLLPKEKKELRLHVEALGSIIKWEFLVKYKDIEFGIFYEASENNVTVILPLWRYSTPDGAEKGSYKCQETGIYIVVFDNMYSWLNSKEVQYCITLENPKL